MSSSRVTKSKRQVFCRPLLYRCRSGTSALYWGGGRPGHGPQVICNYLRRCGISKPQASDKGPEETYPSPALALLKIKGRNRRGKARVKVVRLQSTLHKLSPSLFGTMTQSVSRAWLLSIWLRTINLPGQSQMLFGGSSDSNWSIRRHGTERR